MTLFGDFWSLDRRVFILAAARMVVTLGFAAVLPYLAVVLHHDRGVSATMVGVIWTVAGLSGAVMQWVAGEVADRWGRRPVLLTSMALRTLNLGILGFQIAHRGSILSIAVLCVFNAMLRGFFDPVASAMVADLAIGARRIAAFSLQKIGVNIGWTLGVGVSPLLRMPFGELFYVSAAITLLAAFAASTIGETHPARPDRALSFSRALRRLDLGTLWRQRRFDRRFAGFLVASLFLFLLQAQLYAPLSLYAVDHLHLDLAGVSHLYALNGLMVVGLQLPAFLYIRRVGPERVLVIGGIAYAASYALCGIATGQATLLVCVGFITLSEIITAPAQQTIMTAMAPAGRVGSYAGLFGLTQAVGQSLGPLLGTSLLDLLPDRWTWPLLASFGVAAAFVSHGVLSRRE